MINTSVKHDNFFLKYVNFLNFCLFINGLSEIIEDTYYLLCVVSKQMEAICLEGFSVPISR